MDAAPGLVAADRAAVVHDDAGRRAWHARRWVCCRGSSCGRSSRGCRRRAGRQRRHAGGVAADGARAVHREGAADDLDAASTFLGDVADDSGGTLEGEGARGEDAASALRLVAAHDARRGGSACPRCSSARRRLRCTSGRDTPLDDEVLDRDRDPEHRDHAAQTIPVEGRPARGLGLEAGDDEVLGDDRGAVAGALDGEAMARRGGIDGGLEGVAWRQCRGSSPDSRWGPRRLESPAPGRARARPERRGPPWPDGAPGW